MAWMLNAAAAGVALLAATNSAPELAPLDEQAQTDVLEMEHERYRRLTVPVTIGEHGPFNFMVDTGAQATVLSSQLADRLGITDRRPATLVGMASRRPIEVVSVDDLGLGSRRFSIQVAPLVAQENIGSADGILGVDSLQRQRVLLDFRNNSMSIADADTLGGNGGYEITVRARQKLGQLIITSAKVDGIRAAVIIDTGAQASIGNMQLLKRMRNKREVGVSTMTDINGIELASNMHRTKSITMGRAQLSNVSVAFADAAPFEALGLKDRPALILGMRELKLFNRVAIDFESQKVLFDLPREAQWGSNSNIWNGAL